VLANSGITANTALLDEFSERQKQENPALFASRMQIITEQGQEMKKALEAGDFKAVGEIMTANHKLLVEMEYSHEILDKMCKEALDRGALGAKVTGGGRGGYMVSLTPGQELQEKVATAFEQEGYKVIRAVIGG
jgi:mevalonate kinase